MKRVRTFTLVRVERKPSTRWPLRPSVQREKWRRFAEDNFARMRTFHAALYSDSRAEGEITNPFDTSALSPRAPDQQPRLIAGPRGITDLQIEIMTATLCEAVLNIRTHAGEDAPAAIGKLISAMVKQVQHLNAEVEAANEEKA